MVHLSQRDHTKVPPNRSLFLVGVFLAASMIGAMGDGSPLIETGEAQPAGWTAEIVSTGANRAVALDAVGDGVVYVALGNTTAGAFQYVKSTDSGATWSTESTIDATYNTHGRITCVDENVCGVIFEQSSNLPDIHITEDGGATWAYAGPLPAYCDATSNSASDPNIAIFNASGYLNIKCSIHETVSGVGYRVISNDATNTLVWSGSNRGRFSFLEFVNETNMFASAGFDSAPNDVRVFHSTNNATSFTELKQYNTACYQQQPIVAVDATNVAIQYFNDTDNAATFEVIDSSGNLVSSYVESGSVTVTDKCSQTGGSARFDDQQFAFTYSWLDASNIAHAEVAYTTDGGATWTAVELETEPTTFENVLRSDVGIDANGRLYVAVTDRDNDEVTVYYSDVFVAGVCGTADRCYLADDPLNDIATEYVGDFVYVRETGDGEFNDAIGLGRVIRLDDELGFRNEVNPCPDVTTTAGSVTTFRHNPGSKSLAVTFDGLVLAGCTSTVASGLRASWATTWAPNLAAETAKCSSGIAANNCFEFLGENDNQNQLVVTVGQHGRAVLSEPASPTSVALHHFDLTLPTIDDGGISPFVEPPGLWRDSAIDISPTSDHEYWATGSFGTRAWDQDINLIFRDDNLQGTGIAVWGDEVHIMTDTDLTSYVFADNLLNQTATNTSGPWSSAMRGNLEISADGDYLVAWDANDWYLINVTSNLTVDQTEAAPLVADLESVVVGFGNNVMYAVTSEGAFGWDIFSGTTFFGESGGASPNAVADGAEEFEQQTSQVVQPTDPISGEATSSGFFGVSFEPTAEAAGISVGQTAFFFGILLIFFITGGVWFASGSGIATGLAGALSLGLATVLGFVPTWVVAFIVFVSAAVIVYMRGRT